MIDYAETFAILTPESAEHGDYEEQGFIAESLESDFRYMVDLLKHTEPSSSNVEYAKWFTYYDYHHDYTNGAEESRSYHPKSDRDLHYMIKAWKTGNCK